jgi:hypothetical protein
MESGQEGGRQCARARRDGFAQVVDGDLAAPEGKRLVYAAAG